MLFIIGLLAAGITLSSHSGRFIESLARKYRHARVRAWILDVILTCYSYRAAKYRILIAIAISVIGQGLIILAYYIIGRGLGLGLSITTYLVAIPAVFAASLPVSIGGRIRRNLAGVGAAGGTCSRHQPFHCYLVALWISICQGPRAIDQPCK
jgi:hypothetical protein